MLTIFLSTPSARRATRDAQPALENAEHFYPRPPRGGRLTGANYAILWQEFLSTPSARRATADEPANSGRIRISIHALREEGDQSQTHDKQQQTYFYPRPPRGGRHKRVEFGIPTIEFLSTPSARRATPCPDRPYNRTNISIHALREEGDYCISNLLICEGIFLSTPSARRATGCLISYVLVSEISIHALRKEGDRAQQLLQPLNKYFYPRPPQGGRLRL